MQAYSRKPQVASRKYYYSGDYQLVTSDYIVRYSLC